MSIDLTRVVYVAPTSEKSIVGSCDHGSPRCWCNAEKGGDNATTEGDERYGVTGPLLVLGTSPVEWIISCFWKLNPAAFSVLACRVACATKLTSCPNYGCWILSQFEKFIVADFSPKYLASMRSFPTSSAAIGATFHLHINIILCTLREEILDYLPLVGIPDFSGDWESWTCSRPANEWA